MSKLWKKATLPSAAELLKEDKIKKRLTLELRNSIRALQSQHMGNFDVVNDETSANVCTSLEAIFIHGLKGKFSARMSSVFSGGGAAVKIPEPDFWPVVMMYSHKDVLSRINNMHQMKTDVGRCRSWLRMALNDGLICSYLDTMISDTSEMQNFYTPFAYLLDYEQPGIMKQLLEGVTVFTFQLQCNLSILNIWSSTPLVLAGVWTPPTTPQPVMPAMDVIEFFAEQDKPNNVGKAIQREVPVDAPHSEDTFKGFKVATSDGTVGVITVKEIPEKYEECGSMKKEPDKEISEEGISSGAVTSLHLDQVLAISGSEEADNGKQPLTVSDPNTDFSITVTPAEGPLNIDQSVGNRLWIESGWSSEFEVGLSERETEGQDQESYDSLLHSYNMNRPSNSVSVGTPDLTEIMPETTDENEEEKSESDASLSAETKSSTSDYELIPRSCVFTSEGTDKRTKHLLSVIDKICPEVGLDLQDYQCHGCGCPIGMIYGKANLCHFDGYSFCSDCHRDDEYYIPARIIHNWDFKKYPVAKYTKYFLINTEQEPFFNVKVINPLVYTAFEEMAQLQSLRTQLTFLRSYIFTCKESVVEELRKKVWPREYFYEHVHLYSLNDLLQAASGTLQQTLQKIVTFAKKHVLNCQMCSLKAFICEICNNPKVIYPFDIDVAYHCDQCLAVYHRSCMDLKKFCPKCERKRKWKEAPDSSWYLE